MPPAFSPSPGLAGKRILIIEDNEENRRLFHAVFRLEGAGQVLEAERAQTGIEIAAREQPDLIIMDIQMPGMDGLAATRILRADPTTQHIPIIAVTASATAADRDGTLEAGCIGHISKPIDPLLFGSQITAFLEPDGSPSPS